MGSKRPLVLVDLDDTLFQTARKMPDGTPRIPATVDVHGEPNGYMTQVQQAFIGWLLAWIRSRSLSAFVIYRLALGICLLLSFALR